MWVYNTDYTLVLASTLKGTRLCLQGNTTADVDIVLAACDPTKPAQLWSYEGGARFKGQNSGNTDYGDRCLGTGSSVADNAMAGKVLRNGACASNAEWGSFAPDPSVGAGAASVQTKQIVNYYEFGRCMDVTNENINYALMIIYPCKQDPSGGTQLKWNHKWYYQENAHGGADHLRPAEQRPREEVLPHRLRRLRRRQRRGRRLPHLRRPTRAEVHPLLQEA